MRYLKSYKIFENNSDIKSYINDILLDLTDRGLFYYIYDNISITFTILFTADEMDGDESSKFFDLDDEIFNCFYTLESYLRREKYENRLITLSCKQGYSARFDRSNKTDFADNVDDLKRIVDIFGYKQFTSIVFKFKDMNSKLHKESFHNTPEKILSDIALDLSDEGLYVQFPNDNKFDGKFYLSIEDKDKIFCKDYPKNDMDWLWGKPIMNEFVDRLEDFNLFQDKDYKVYGGGLFVNFVFDDKNIIEL